MQDEIDMLKAEQASFKEKEQQLSETISAAQRDTDTLEQVLKDATSLLQRNNADFGVEMEQIRQEMQKLSGRLEEFSFSLERQQQALKLFKEDVEIRFSQGAGVALPDNAKELFKFSSDKFQEADFKVARRGFQKFVSKFPKDRKVADAYFFLGESFFKDAQYVNAVGAYQNILQSFPKSGVADDATHRIGQSFFKLNKCKEAAVFFESVVKDYKKSKWRSEAQKNLKLAKAGKCN